MIETSEKPRNYSGEIEAINVIHRWKDQYIAEIKIKELEYPFRSGLMLKQDAENYFAEYKIGGNVWIEVEKNKKGFWEITKKAAAAPQIETAKELNDEEENIKSKGSSELKTKIWVSKEKTLQVGQYEPVKETVGIQKGFETELSDDEISAEMKKLGTLANAEVEEQLKYSTVSK